MQIIPPFSATRAVTIKVTDVDEKPAFSGDDPAIGKTAIEVNEGNTALDEATPANVTYTATDQDGLNVNLTLMGPDAAKFTLSTQGVLSFRAEPDYEEPTDANRDNVYEVTIRASDGTLHTDRKVKVTVANVNEAPEITVVPATGLSISGSSSPSVAEGTTSVATYRASGPNAASATWTLGGADAADFSISNAGVLRFATTPDYDDPADAGGDNVYEVAVTATDSEGASDSIDVTVTVTDVDDTQQPSDPLLADFDPNGDGVIEVADMRRAVGDYFGSSPTLSETEMRRLVGIYFSQ